MSFGTDIPSSFQLFAAANVQLLLQNRLLSNSAAEALEAKRQSGRWLKCILCITTVCEQHSTSHFHFS